MFIKDSLSKVFVILALRLIQDHSCGVTHCGMLNLKVANNDCEVLRKKGSFPKGSAERIRKERMGSRTGHRAFLRAVPEKLNFWFINSAHCIIL